MGALARFGRTGTDNQGYSILSVNPTRLVVDLSARSEIKPGCDEQSGAQLAAQARARYASTLPSHHAEPKPMTGAHGEHPPIPRPPHHLLRHVHGIRRGFRPRHRPGDRAVRGGRRRAAASAIEQPLLHLPAASGDQGLLFNPDGEVLDDTRVVTDGSTSMALWVADREWADTCASRDDCVTIFGDPWDPHDVPVLIPPEAAGEIHIFLFETTGYPTGPRIVGYFSPCTTSCNSPTIPCSNDKLMIDGPRAVAYDPGAGEPETRSGRLPGYNLYNDTSKSPLWDAYLARNYAVPPCSATSSSATATASAPSKGRCVTRASWSCWSCW